MYKIFSVPQYDKYTLDGLASHTTIAECYSSNNIMDIVKQLQTDAQYHERLMLDPNIKLNIDLDGYPIKKFIPTMIQFCKDNLNIDLDVKDFKYTTNSAKPNSHHVVIPKYWGLSSTIKQIFRDFRIWDESDDVIFIDHGHLGVGGQGKWFRLPNQTKEQVQGTEHIIKCGKMSNFVLAYIETDSICLDEVEIIKETKQNLKQPNVIYNVEPCNIDLSNKYIRFLNLFSKSRFESYDDWLRSGMIIKSLGLTVDVWDELSKQASNYDPKICAVKFNSFKRSQFTEASLYWTAKLDNPIEFEKLRLEYNNQPAPIVKCLVDQIEYDKKYLIENDEDFYLTDYFDTFYNDPASKVFTNKSAYGTGKTQLLKKMIIKHNPKKILWLSFRITLTNDIIYNFGDLGFESYQNRKYDSDRLVCQLESLLNIDPDYFEDESIVPSYDLIVIDEIESILAHFSSDTFKGRSRIIFEYLEQLCKASKKIVALDGDLDNRSYAFLQQFESSIHLKNNYLNREKELKIVEDELLFSQSIISELDLNHRIVICSMSSEEATKQKNILTEAYPDKQIFLYTGKTSDIVKNEHLSDVTKFWSTADVVIYSPTVEAGVNFDIKDHFHKIYGILCTQSTSQRSFLQMLSRVRHHSDKSIMILNTKIKLNTTTNFYTFDEVKEGLISTRSIVLKADYVEENGQIIKRKIINAYDINSIYNKVEALNKNTCYFIQYLKQLSESKGYSFEYVSKDAKPIAKEINNQSRSELILNQIDISNQEYQGLLLKQHQMKASEEDKLLIERHYYKKVLGVDKLNETILKNFYHNESTIKNFIYLLDDYILNSNADAKAENRKACINIVNELIETLGFTIYNSKSYSQSEFIKKIDLAFKNSLLFTDSKTSKILFNQAKTKIEQTNIKQVMGYINSILKNYNLKISSVYAKGKKKIGENLEYTLNQLNGINEIIHYLKSNGQIINDPKKQIIEPTEFIYGDLVIEKVIKPVIDTNKLDVLDV